MKVFSGGLAIFKEFTEKIILWSLKVYMWRSVWEVVQWVDHVKGGVVQ